MESISVMSLFVFFCLLGRLDCTDQTNLTVNQEDVTLECSGPRDATLIMIRWEKPDLQSENFVICFIDGQRQDDIQHELFKDRVKMKNPKWKETGDFSLILKNVTTNDAGTYTCEAGYDGQTPQLLSRVTLKVEVPDQKKLKSVKQGADATLECSGPTDATLIMIRWEKSDLQSEDFVICFRDGQFQKDIQHELFKDRVKMKNPKWKETGDFSVILKNVTTNDAGTYTCEAGYDGQKPKLLSTVTLKVVVPGQSGGHTEDGEIKDGGNENGKNNREDGSVGQIVFPIVGIGLIVGVVLIVTFVINKKKCGNRNKNRNRKNTTAQHHSYALAPMGDN